MSYLNSLAELLYSFGKIGMFSLGGGNSMIKMIEHECVAQRHWLTIEEFNGLVGGSFLFPGLTAVKIASLIGFKVAGSFGLMAAFFAINIPGVLLSVGAISFLLSHRDNPVVLKLIRFMEYAAIALFASALYAMIKPMPIEKGSILLWIATAALFVASSFFNVSPFIGIFFFLGICFLLPI